MNKTREVGMYVGLEEGGCVDVGSILLNAGWVLVRASELAALQEKADRPDKLALYLLSIAEVK